tara:strand:- start:389 stop:694 length:306 start_codon:yes stop_codon:yes gene_type:complete
MDILSKVLDKYYVGKWETFPNPTGTMTDFENIVWIGDAPSKSDFQAQYDTEEQAYNNAQYQRDRLQEYPTIEECIHAILDDDLEALQARRIAVKTKYPKPE